MCEYIFYVKVWFGRGGGERRRVGEAFVDVFGGRET